MRSIEKVYINFFPKLRTEIYVAMFEHLSKHSLAYFQQNFSGDLANKISGMAEGIEAIIKISIPYILGNFFYCCYINCALVYSAYSICHNFISLDCYLCF
jgi:ABC-type transport system involved in Fe-S cluster assembly fused permease/ATPase subunit